MQQNTTGTKQAMNQAETELRRLGFERSGRVYYGTFYFQGDRAYKARKRAEAIAAEQGWSYEETLLNSDGALSCAVTL